MVEESKYCTHMMKKHFNKKLVMTKEDDEDFEISANINIRFVIMFIIYGDIKVRYHSDINGKYRGSAHRDCNINVKLNHKIPTVFHNLKNYDSHLIMQKLGKFNFEINTIPNGIEKYMSFKINNRLSLLIAYNF